MTSSSESKQARNKELLLEQFKKTPIVQVACEKLNIGRASYYRWRKEDSEFAKQADIALHEGNMLVNDMAESQLLSAIRDKNLTAIIFWLKHHHIAYANRVELSGHLRHSSEQLTPEQEQVVSQALKMAGFLPQHIPEKPSVPDTTSDTE